MTFQKRICILLCVSGICTNCEKFSPATAAGPKTPWTTPVSVDNKHTNS
jgi:hypothetical protein